MGYLDTPKYLTCNPVTSDPTKPSKVHSPVDSINKVGGFFTIPTFSLANIVWYNIPRLLGQFNYTVTQDRFTIESPLSYNTNNYVFAVKYRKCDIVYRYKLFDNGNKINFIPLYNGERIYSNFCIEVWSVGDNASIASNNLIVYNTSLRNFPVPLYSILPVSIVRSVSPFLTAINITFPLLVNNQNVVWLTNKYGISSSLNCGRHNLLTLFDFN